MMLNFEEEYAKFIEFHCKRRTGERRERLLEAYGQGQGHAERRFLQHVWWPAFRHFDWLHPEYEIRDFRDGYRYIDFAYIQSHFRIAIEIDGLGPHWRNITKWKFSDYCQRQNHLVIDGWHVLRFTYDDVDEHPRLCEQTLHQLMGRLFGDASADMASLSVIQREIVRFAVRCARPITPAQVSAFLEVSHDTAIRQLKQLSDSLWLQPAGGTVRIRSYRLHQSRSNIQW